MNSIKGRTIVISGGSRGIGKAIALRCAREGANIAILAKTITPHPRLPGTIYTAAEEIEKAGGCALPVPCDIRMNDQIISAVSKIIARFGAIDVLVNNASAIQLSDTQNTTVKKWDLMHAVCVRGTFLLTQACLPHLLRSNQARIICISPPLNMHQKWFSGHLPYTIAKYGMSMCVLGWAGEFRGRIAVNALWPRTLIDTAALSAISEQGANLGQKGRTPDIMADACIELLKRDPNFTGNFVIDETVLTESGIVDFSKYSVSDGGDFVDDLFIETNEGKVASKF
jgi:citronellol/citronellal dehydrogenase